MDDKDKQNSYDTEEDATEDQCDASTDNAEEKTVEDGAEDQSGAETVEASEQDQLRILFQTMQAENGRLHKDLESKKAESARFQTQANTLNDRLASTVSEYENYRRRTTAEKESISVESSVNAIKALLPALDNFYRAMEFSESNPESFKEGVEMTFNQLKTAFESLGVEEIHAEVGQSFDPALHNAVAHVDDEDLGESVVAEVFQKGYAIGDKVIRHTVVKVAN
ncbi:MAG TPA: nucleotide exchange factor GrpE [Ruminococcaceae bacterium]|nr:nucleotide exchange factor GrpE [Oscillospiraceae bacterium]